MATSVIGDWMIDEDGGNGGGGGGGDQCIISISKEMEM